jgi:predicted nucleotidyltransferase
MDHGCARYVYERLAEIFKLRDITRGTENETVFALYMRVDAIDKAPYDLDEEIKARLRHYFRIPNDILLLSGKEKAKG